MELKVGYEKTDIGILPDDWEVILISKVCQDIFLGLTSKVDYVSYDGVPLVRATDIANGKLDFTNAKTISKIQHQKLTKNRITKRGDILVSKSGSLGVCAIVDTDNEFSTYESIITISPKKKLLSEYVLWLLRDESTQTRMIGEKVGSSVSHLNIKMFRDLKIPLPPTTTEQTAIATALSDTDALITSIEKLVAKKRLIKQGAMQKLLTPKEGWEVKKLGEIAEMYSGGTPLTSNSNYYDGIIPWIVIADITKAGKYISDTEKCISTEGINNSSARLYPKGTLFFAMYASIGKTTISLVEASCNQAILGINPKSINKEYLYYFLSYNEVKYATSGQTGTQSNLSKDIVQNLDITFPSIQDEQAQIATILSDMDTEIKGLETKLAKYKQIKQGMMQNLLTGKIRLV